MRLGVGGKKNKQTNHNIKELGEKTSQFTGRKQGKTIKINRKWNEDGGYRDKTEVKKTLQTAGKCVHVKI